MDNRPRFARHLRKPSARGQSLCGVNVFSPYDRAHEDNLAWVNCPDCLRIVKEMHSG